MSNRAYVDCPIHGIQIVTVNQKPVTEYRHKGFDMTNAMTAPCPVCRKRLIIIVGNITEK